MDQERVINIKLIAYFLSFIVTVILLAVSWVMFVRPIPDPAIRIATTSKEITEAKESLEESRERTQIIHERTHEIRFIPQEVRRNVQALDSDAVAIGIMAELELFRRSNDRAGRVDNAGERVLFDRPGGAGRVVRAPIPQARERSLASRLP